MEDDAVSNLGEHLYSFCCPSSRNLNQNKINLRDFTTNIKARQNKSLTIKKSAANYKVKWTVKGFICVWFTLDNMMACILYLFVHLFSNTELEM